MLVRLDPVQVDVVDLQQYLQVDGLILVLMPQVASQDLMVLSHVMKRLVYVQLRGWIGNY